MDVFVLRLGHRRERDHRISTHCALVARAMGAKGIIYTGDYDKKMEESVADVRRRWGGSFWIRHEKSWKAALSGFGGGVVHLTMYGIPVQSAIGKIGAKKALVVVGGEKVPPEIYQMADYNVAVTSQPHSEVAALAIFMDRFLGGKGLSKRHSNAEIKVIPQAKGKKVAEVNRYKARQS